MRRSAFALIALFPTLACANEPQPSTWGATTPGNPAMQSPGAVPDAGQIGAAMGGDALPCGEAPAITSSDVSEGLGSNALADADAYADKLGELSGKAVETVKSLNETYPIGEDAVKRNYFVAVCQRLKEKSVAIETLKPALATLAQALGLPEPAAAQAAPNQPAAPAGEQVAIALPAPATSVEPKAPETAPTAPAEPTPAAPTDIQPPSTPAEAAAPAAEARPESADRPVADTKIEPAPAGVPADPAATEQKTESPALAASPETSRTADAAPAAQPSPPSEAAPQPAPAAGGQPVQGQTPPGTPGAEQPAAPQTSTMAQGDAPATLPELKPAPEPVQASPGSVEDPAASRTPAPTVAETPAAATSTEPAQTPVPTAMPSAAPDTAPGAPPSTPSATAEAPATPAPETAGNEQPAAPQTSTMAQGEAPAAQPEPKPAPEPLQSSPGSVEQPAATQAPVPSIAQVPAEVPAAPAAEQPVAQGPIPPGTPGAEQPAAPQTSTMAQGDASATQPEPKPAPEPLQSSPGSVEQPAATQAPAATTAQGPAEPAQPPASGAPPAAVAEAPVAGPAGEPGASAPPAPPVVAAPSRPRAPLPAGASELSEDACRTLGVTGHCADLNAVLAQLLEKPLEYNRPQEMFLYRQSAIGLVLRTDWEGKDMPAAVSEELKGLPGEVRQGLTKITRVMSAELSGSGFDIAPSGRQERMVMLPQPVSWNWQVTPKDTGPGKPLKLQLFAHLEGPNGSSPVLLKTLDSTIGVDVKTWDWIVAQVRAMQPIYAIIAAILAVLTVFLTYSFTRNADAGPGKGTRKGGPVIGDLDQTGKPRDES